MKFLITLLLLTSTAFASTAKFEMDFSIKSLSSDGVLADFSCQVTQTLTWENSSNFFKCSDDMGNTVSVMNVAVTLGYDYDRRQAYTIYETVGKRGLVSSLFEKLGIEQKLVRGAGVKIFYRNSYPAATSAEYMIEGQDDGFAITIGEMRYID